MAARKIGKRWYVDFRHAGTRVRKPSPDNTKAGATAYETILRLRLAHGEQLESYPAPALTFAAFSERWFARHVMPNNKASEQRTKASILQLHLLPVLGKHPLSAVRGEAIEEYKAKKQSEGLHPKTINNQLLVLSKCLRSAHEWDLLDRLPVVRLIKDVPDPETIFLSRAEANLLVSVADEQRWRDMALVALRTGARRGELLALAKGDMNPTTGVLTISRNLVRGQIGTPKGRKTRYVPLTQDAREVFLRGPAHGFLFGSPDGTPPSESEAQKAIIRLCKRAGIKRIGWHALRHTFATELSMLGTPIAEIAELMGHASIATTRRYIHFAPEVLRGAIDRLEDSLRPQPTNIWARLGSTAATATKARAA